MEVCGVEMQVALSYVGSLGCRHPHREPQHMAVSQEPNAEPVGYNKSRLFGLQIPSVSEKGE